MEENIIENDIVDKSAIMDTSAEPGGVIDAPTESGTDTPTVLDTSECPVESGAENGLKDVLATDNEKKSPTTADPGKIPLPHEPTDKKQSNLTIENLKLHEKEVIKEELEISRRSSGSPVKPLSQHSIPDRTSSPLAPLKDGCRPGSGQKRVGSGQRENSGHKDDGTTLLASSGESLRTGSGKPLPPIGAEKVSECGQLDDTEKQDSFMDQSGSRTSMPRILRYSQENFNENEMAVPVRSASNVQSERPTASKTPKRNIPSPAEREVIRSMNPDGSERVAISIATETEWSWLHSVKMAGKLGERDSLEIEANEKNTPWTSSLPTKKRHHTTSFSSTSHLSEGAGLNEPVSSSDVIYDTRLQKSDEKLEKEAESEYSDEDVHPLPPGTLIPRIGPPRIIQYQRESECVISQPTDPSQRTLAKHIISTASIEFPEENEYTLNNQMLAKSSSHINRKRSKRKSDRHSGASSPVSDITDMLGLDGGPCEFCNEEIKPFPTPEMQQTMSPEESSGSDLCVFCQQEMIPIPTVEMQHTMQIEELYCCEEYQKLVEFTLTSAEADDMHEELIDIAPHAPYGSKQARRAAKERAAARLREREMVRQRIAGANQPNFYAFARQMKVINYALSSQKCLDEGWTVQAPTPVDDEEQGPDPYQAQPVFHLPLLSFKHQKSKTNETNIVNKIYDNGKSFMVMFEDGTGTIFYPSGNAAVIIASATKGQYEYFVQDDTPHNGNLLGVFEPNGRGTCYQSNGQIKLNLTPYRGLYLDQKGNVKKRWLWKDSVTHTHPPPFHPICFAINKALSLRCIAQDQIFLQFNQDKRTVRFNVGVKLKLVKPENLPKDEVDEHLLYLSDIKAYFQIVTDKIHNAIKFSKSPKLSNMKPPYQLQKDLLRNEKLKTKKVQQQVAGKGAPIVTVN